MCGNEDKPPKTPPKEIRRVGDAENAAHHGDQAGYVAAGGLEGDDKRGAVADAMRYVREYNSPLANLGIFAARQIDGAGAGKLKSGLSNANPFYVSMAATAEAQAKHSRGAASTQPTRFAITQPPGAQSIKTHGSGNRAQNSRIGG